MSDNTVNHILYNRLFKQGLYTSLIVSKDILESFRKSGGGMPEDVDALETCISIFTDLYNNAPDDDE